MKYACHCHVLITTVYVSAVYKCLPFLFLILRCSLDTNENYVPEKFKLGEISPGKENNCNGFPFILENNIELTSVASSEAPPPLPGCSSSLGNDAYAGVTPAMVDQIIQTQLTYANHESCVTSNYETMDERVEVRMQEQEDRLSILGESKDVPEYENPADFNQNWIKQMETHQKDILPITKIKTDKTLYNWLTYFFDEKEKSKSKLGCRICIKYFDEFKFPRNHKPDLANKGGTIKPTTQLNTNMLNDHAKSPVHLGIVERLKVKREKRLATVVNAAEKKKEAEENGKYQVTANMFKVSYASIRANIPFMSHNLIVNVVKSIGGNLGVHHYESTSAVRMAEVISKEMHETLRKSLISKKFPMSIILDGTTDMGLHHYLVVLIQTLEDNRPVMYFYKLIELVADESAEGQLNVLEREFKKDGDDFFKYIKANMVGFGADGASVNSGRIAGLGKKLSNFISRPFPLFQVHCMPHRLELAVKHAIESNKFWDEFGKTMNGVDVFYTGHSQKRMQFLRAHALAKLIKLYALSSIFKQRWSASQKQSVQNFIHNWHLLVENLQSMSVDKSFMDKAGTSCAAIGHLNRISKRGFVVGMHFLLDLLSGVQRISKFWQKSAGVIIGKEESKLALMKLISTLEVSNGVHTTAFFKDVVCSDKAGRTCTEKEYLETSTSVKFKGVELEKDVNVLEFTFARKELCQKLLAEIKRYFPESEFSEFEIFVPSKLPKDIADAQVYGQSQVQDLAKRFKLPEITTANEWKELLINLIGSNTFCSQKGHAPDVFWPYYLRKKDFFWGSNIKALIETALVLPSGSADAERAFSILKHIKYDRRSSLTSAHLDDLLRIRINGPNDVSKFSAARYARAWVNKYNHMLTDDTTQKRKIADLESDENANDFNDDEDVENNKYFTSSNLF